MDVAEEPRGTTGRQPQECRTTSSVGMATASGTDSPRITARTVSTARRRLRSRFKAEGKAEGEARALLAILDARHIQVPDHVRADIMACTDTTQLEAWIRRAATADKIQEVVD
jgi:hypothetical protein